MKKLCHPVQITITVLWKTAFGLPQGHRINACSEVRNRFKGLDLIDKVPDELWTEVRDIVQEAGIKTIPMEKKCKKAEWLSEEGLQIAWFYLVHKSSLVGTEWKLTLSPHSLSLGWFQKWGRHSIIKGWWFGKARSHHDSPRSHSP